MTHHLDRRPSLWLVLGVALIAAAHMRWGVGVLGFIAPVPFLRYLRLTTGWQRRLLFLAVLVLLGALVLARRRRRWD